jgi:hypothetical protein
VLNLPLSTIDSITYTISNPGNLAIISTTAITNITPFIVSSGGNITDDGGSPITDKGVCWSVSSNPTTANDKISNGSGSGSYTCSVGGLLANTVYYIRAYATNSAGTSYGNELMFNTLDSNSLYVGKNYGGGIIAYILQPGDLGYDPIVNHGFIVSETDLGSYEWGCQGTSILTASGIGEGMSNTLAIVDSCTTIGIAAQVCNDLDLNGYTDWYLPSIDELNMLYTNQSLIGGGFTNTSYWSSTELGSAMAYGTNIYTGHEFFNLTKVGSNFVRAVRSF